MKYVTIDTIFNKVLTETREGDFNETDVLTWFGEAFDFLTIKQSLEEVVEILEVKNNTVTVPIGFYTLNQMAKYDNYSVEPTIVHTCIPNSEIPVTAEVEELCSCLQEEVKTILLEYKKNKHFTCDYFLKPITKSTHSFFSQDYLENNNNNYFEYKFTGVKQEEIEFNFKEGYILMSYNKILLDENGIPLIPDSPSHILAATYYVKWKMAEKLFWVGRENSGNLVKYNEDRWLKYCKQAKNSLKMPQTLDDYLILKNQSKVVFSDSDSYYGFFGNLGREEVLNYKIRNSYGKQYK